jgi:hypothetical protein
VRAAAAESRTAIERLCHLADAESGGERTSRRLAAMMRQLSFLLLLASGCIEAPASPPGSMSPPPETATPFGTYHATRTLIESAPSPAFEFPEAITIRLTSEPTHAVVIEAYGTGYYLTKLHEPQLTFGSVELWPSPDGTADVKLIYKLEVPGDDTLSGFIDAYLTVDQPDGALDYHYRFSVEGAK